MTQLRRHHHETTRTVLGALGEHRRYTNVPSEYRVHDDISIPDYGLPPTENLPFTRGRRARRSIRRDVNPPRASYDTVTHPPIWSDIMIRPYTYPDPYIPTHYSQRPSTQAGPSSFTPSWTSFGAFHSLSGFDTSSIPGPSSQTICGTIIIFKLWRICPNHVFGFFSICNRDLMLIVGWKVFLLLLQMVFPHFKPKAQGLC